jgi:gliding motility-associated-like protein
MRWLTFLFIFIALQVHGQAPGNDGIDNAITITNPDAFCSADAAFNNIGATSINGASQLWNGNIGKDVWFKFTALKFDLSVTVSGKINNASTNTMLNPLVAIYIRDVNTNGLTEIPGSLLTSNNVTSFYKGALTIGQVYYIRISATNNNEGTFKLCVDNFFPPLAPGQDCSSLSILCTTEKFTQINVSGTGASNTESAGTCLGNESNSAWYKWTAAKNGPFTFLITPTVTTNDIDWILYDLGPGGNCSNANAATAIRCASGSGVTCAPSYYITGLSMTETDLSEQAGCPIGIPQNGLVKYVDLVAGNNYALLVDNFSSGNNGFNIEFGGTAEFTGPVADFSMAKIDECLPQQSFEFTNLSTNYNSLKWTFGEGASIATATGDGPYNITYSTPGDKVVVLEAKTAGGCDVVKTMSFTVTFKPATPTATYATPKLCPDNTLTLQTPTLDKATYNWSGPNGFISTEQNPQITITGPENSGDYLLYVQVGNCQSDVFTLNIPLIDVKPVSSFTIATNFPCENNLSFTFKNTSNYTDTTWDFDGGTVNSEPNGDETVVYTTSGTKNIKLTIKSPTGCEDISTQQLIVQLKPETPIITSNTVKYCPGNDVTLSTATVANAIYHWSGPNNFTSTDQNPQITITGPENSGNYQLIVEVGGCMSDAGIINVPTIDLKPEAIFVVVPNNKCQANQSYTFKNSSKNYQTLTWDFGVGVSNTSTAANGDINVIYNTNGVKNILLTVTSPSGCVATATTNFEVQLKPITPIITINRPKFCLGDTIKISIDSQPGVTYKWIGPNNFTSDQPAFEIPVTDFNVAGKYQILLQIGECTSDLVSITIPPIGKVPVASFGTNPTYSGKYAAPFPITFINNSQDADTYLWDFGDGTTSVEINPTHTFLQPGNYKIKLTAFADEGCSNSIDIGDLIIKDISLFVPNTFSPNGDGVNDEFVVTVLNLKKYKINIFNRAGENLFQSSNIFENWKGTFKNQEVPVGVYYYVISGTNVYDKDVKYTGSLTLIR